MKGSAHYRGWLARQDTYAHWNLVRFKLHKQLGTLPKITEWTPKTLAHCETCRKGYWLEDGHTNHKRKRAKNHAYAYYYDKHGNKIPTFTETKKTPALESSLAIDGIIR